MHSSTFVGSHLRHLLTVLTALTVGLAASAWSHGANAGDIEITHPYATPTIAGSKIGAAYFAQLTNAGSMPDKLLRASTPVAASVEMHTMSVDAQGVMRMREIDSIALTPKQSIAMRPGMGMHLMLIGLRAPLTEGQTFPMTLQFERGGTVEVKVVVQTPRPGASAEQKH